MSEEATPTDQIAFLARSETRVRVLRELAERDRATQRACREAVDASRSTVARTLAALEERDWVRESGGRYAITPAGEVVVEAFTDLVDVVAAADELAPFLRWFPTDEFDLDVAALEGAGITASTEGDPYAPADRQSELLREAAACRCLLPSIELQGARVIRDRCCSEGLDMETVLSPRVAETITTGEHARVFRDMIEDGGHDVYVTDEPLPFYLGVLGDGTVKVGVEDDEGFPRALLVTDDETVREWAESVYERHRERAERLPVERLEP